MVKKNLKTLILQTAFGNYKNEVGLTPGYKNKGHWSDMRTPVTMLCRRVPDCGACMGMKHSVI